MKSHTTMKPPAHAARAHATLSPSKADMWMTCTASIGLIEKIKPIDISGPAAQEGTAAHELLETSWKARKNPVNFLGKKFNRDWPATHNMIEAVQVLYDIALSLELDGWTIHSEKNSPISCTQEGGTVDIAAVKKTAKGWRIKIFDYKHGQGVIVSAKENPQMRLYCIGILEKLGIEWDDIAEIELIIVQPRAQREPSSWFDSATGLKKFYEEVVKVRKDIKAGNVVFKPSEKACRWCPVKNNCKAFASRAISDARLDFEDVTSTKKTADKKTVSKKVDAVVRAMSIDEMSVLAGNMDFIQMWLTAFRVHIFELAAKAKLPGYKVVLGDANRKWKDEDDVALKLRKLGFDIDDFMPRQLVGITKASELFEDKKKREAFMTKNTTKPEGKPCLVPSSDSRPAINPADDFAGITKE